MKNLIASILFARAVKAGPQILQARVEITGEPLLLP